MADSTGDIALALGIGEEIAGISEVAAVVAMAWIALDREAGRVGDDPAGRIDYGKFDSEGSCAAVGGLGDSGTSTCGG